jgi:hypothetical protein
MLKTPLRLGVVGLAALGAAGYFGKDKVEEFVFGDTTYEVTGSGQAKAVVSYRSGTTEQITKEVDLPWKETVRLGESWDKASVTVTPKDVAGAFAGKFTCSITHNGKRVGWAASSFVPSTSCTALPVQPMGGQQ